MFEVCIYGSMCVQLSLTVCMRSDLYVITNNNQNGDKLQVLYMNEFATYMKRRFVIKML